MQTLNVLFWMLRIIGGSCNFFCCDLQPIIQLEQKTLFKLNFFTKTHCQPLMVVLNKFCWSVNTNTLWATCTFYRHLDILGYAKYIFDLDFFGIQRHILRFCISCVLYISVFETSCKAYNSLCPNQTSNGIRLVNKHISVMSIC